MKTKRDIYPKIKFFLGLIIILTVSSCEREISGDAVAATYPSTADVFTDAPVGLTDEFFISFDPADGANVNGFGTDENEVFLGTSSIRIDVPSPSDPDGGFIGGIFRDRGNGRDLTNYDALTFWAKGSTTGTIGTVGFGTDFLEDKFPVSRSGIQLTTGWKKYIIPIPNASKLIQEKGMFLFAAGGLDVIDTTPNGNEIGWTFWIDEIRFETLGTNKQIGAQMLDGQNQNLQAFTGTTRQLSGFSQTVNIGTGENLTIDVAPSYFDFLSSVETVASIDNEGLVSVDGSLGMSTISATLNGMSVDGSLSVTSNGELPHAPIPTRDAANVVSLFSDVYTNVPVKFYNGFFQFATTQGGAGSDPQNVDIKDEFPNGDIDNIINYTDLNFVSIGTFDNVPFADISETTHLHVDINVREAIDASDFIRLLLESGTGSGSTTAGNFIITSTMLNNAAADGWLSLDIPLSSFPGFTDTANLGQLFFVSDATISDIWVDNVYFYKN